MVEAKQDLAERTKQFSLMIIQAVSALPSSKVGDVIGRQLLRSATSIGANYREAARAQSASEFRYKINIVEKEAAETQYWLELLQGSSVGPSQVTARLHREATELLAIFTTISRKARNNVREDPQTYVEADWAESLQVED